MVDHVAHQVKVHIPRYVAEALHHIASVKGVRLGTLCRMLVRTLLWDDRALASGKTESLSPARKHVASDATIKVLLTQDEWSRIKQLSADDDSTLGSVVTEILCSAVSSPLSERRR